MSDVKENKMGVMPVGRLLFTMSVPMIMSMLVQALYNVVDSIFVARLSEDALTAVSLAFPITNLMIAFGVGTGVGVSALVSRHLGEKDFEKANSVATHGFWLALFTSIIFMAMVFFGAKPFFYAQAQDEIILNYGIDYAMIVGTLSVGLFFQTMVEKLLASTGLTLYSMILQMTGAITNIILDPIMIFGLFGCPAMGVKGAAIATVTGQFLAATIGIIFNLKINKDIKFSMIKYKPSLRVIKNIYRIGFPSIVLAAVGSVMIFGLNKILMAFSSTATAVLGVYFRLQSFIFMPIFGLNNGMVPIIAYNYGAKNPDRIKKVLKYAYVTAITIMIMGMVVFHVMPDVLLSMFDASPDMLEMGVPAFRTVSLCFGFAGFCIISSSFFQALGYAVTGMMMAIFRQLIIILPLSYVLAKFGGLSMVWWAFPIAEILSVMYCIFFVAWMMKKVINPMYDEKKPVAHSL